MTWREIIDLVHDYEDRVSQHPGNQGVRPGCDCGCGGDLMTDDDWQEADIAEEQVMERVLHFCDKYGIDYTGGYA